MGSTLQHVLDDLHLLADPFAHPLALTIAGIVLGHRETAVALLPRNAMRPRSTTFRGSQKGLGEDSAEN